MALRLLCAVALGCLWLLDLSGGKGQQHAQCGLGLGFRWDGSGFQSTLAATLSSEQQASRGLIRGNDPRRVRR